MAKNKIDTRVTILKVALQLFMEKGYRDTSYQDLIDKTGLSKGAIYHHFKSKEGILISVFEFLYGATKQPIIIEPEDKVKDYKSFVKLYTETKKGQFRDFKKFLGTKTLKFNKFLFFFEAINENEKLKKISAEILKQEMKFFEKCFLGLKKHNKLTKDKDTGILAESLFLMLEGAGIIMLFGQNNEREEDWIKMYSKTIKDFFKII